MWRQAEIGAMQLSGEKSPGLPAATRGWEGAKGEILPESLQRERGPAETLILDFWPPELWRNNFLFYAILFVVACYAGSRKLIRGVSEHSKKMLLFTHLGIGLTSFTWWHRAGSQEDTSWVHPGHLGGICGSKGKGRFSNSTITGYWLLKILKEKNQAEDFLGHLCFCPQGTSGHVWRHFWLSQLGRGATGIQGVEAKDAAECLTLPGATPHNKEPSIL